LRTPDERKEEFRTEAQEEASLLRWADTDQSGVYIATIGIRQETEEIRYFCGPDTDSGVSGCTACDLSRLRLGKGV
jgi:hypothetical protein